MRRLQSWKVSANAPRLEGDGSVSWNGKSSNSVHYEKAASINMSTTALDILAIAAHRDDVEQTCGGTLLKAAQRGQRTGDSRSDTRRNGNARRRRRPRARGGRRSKILGVGWRRALNIPDGRVENTWENRLKVASVIRETQSTRGDSALLEGTASGSLHYVRAGI